MDALGDDPNPVPHARLAGAYWLASRLHEEEKCRWCAQLREADARAQRAEPVVRRSTAAWVVPPGLPPRPATPGG
ncbi:hypothetical protein AB0M39_35510 [Streptomyces sp. NPDC051907]|uniref:hypothetical protein n=1 Tax=Streptomyces sp. NPDC051907 TaxID=3155284 RepID=UPI0034432CC4